MFRPIAKLVWLRSIDGCCGRFFFHFYSKKSMSSTATDLFDWIWRAHFLPTSVVDGQAEIIWGSIIFNKGDRPRWTIPGKSQFPYRVILTHSRLFCIHSPTLLQNHQLTYLNSKLKPYSIVKMSRSHQGKGTKFSENEAMDYEFSYTTKDLILYALSIGFGSSPKVAEKELRFLYETHSNFSTVPTFVLTFTFWAKKEKANTLGIPVFPPPIMTEEDVIPRRFLRGDVENLSMFPVIHTWQSIVWDQSLPLPAPKRNGTVQTKMNFQTISVAPKSIGTFVTSQSRVVALDPQTLTYSRICTMQSTALVLGMAKEKVIQFEQSGIDRLTSKPKIQDDTPPQLEWIYPTVSSQALLYRLSSGDSNHIHVDTSAAEMLGCETRAPLLHGLFSLAVAYRAMLNLVNDADTRIRKLEGKFTQPAFVGDVFAVKVWEDKGTEGRYLFRVLNNNTGATLVDCGSAEFDLRKKASDVISSKL